MTILRSILVPVDGSAPSIAALDHALALAEDQDASIEVLGVIAEPASELVSPRRDIEGAVEAGVGRARMAIGNRVGRRIVTGDPVREIVEIAGAEGVDLIVIGTHGRIGRLHEILGSVAEGVVRNAPCPVLTVRGPGEGYQSFAERRHNRPTLAEQVAHARDHGG